MKFMEAADRELRHCGRSVVKLKFAMTSRLLLILATTA